MDFARVTSKGQMTIPKRVRQAAGLHTGDVVAFDLDGPRVSFRKISLSEDGYLKGAAATVAEWSSPEDDDAWRDL